MKKNLVAFVTMTFHLYSKKSNSSTSLVTTATRRTIGLVAIVARDFERLEKKSCGICDNDFSALPENISQGLVAIVTRHFERVEKNLVAFVTTIF